MGVWLDKQASTWRTCNPWVMSCQPLHAPYGAKCLAGLVPGSLKGTYQLHSYFGQQTPAVERRREQVLKTWPAIFHPVKTLSQQSGSQLSPAESSPRCRGKVTSWLLATRRRIDAWLKDLQQVEKQMSHQPINQSAYVIRLHTHGYNVRPREEHESLGTPTIVN